MSLSPAFLDELRARTTLSALIGKDVKLVRAGREFKGCCPFHDEKTPSFYVNDEKQFMHCFGCSAHGDAIRWLTDYKGLEFIDAVKQLAAAAGMDMPPMDARQQQREDERAPLLKAMEAAASFYAGKRDGAAEYLDRRGVTPALASTFGLGFAPEGGNTLEKHVGGPTQVLVDAGLLISLEGKAPYDRFRGRLMFPIKDPRGRVIAFGGRIIGSGEPKYLNSPDTMLFDKGHTLYNLDRAAAAARRTGRLIAVEGYMDVIGLARVGIHEVVAPNGTAVTDAQLGLMWRLVDVPILCLDGDAAGRKAMVRAALRALPLLTPGKSIAFAAMPSGEDPDDVARAGGAEAIEGLLLRTKSLVELIWQTEVAGTLETPESRAALRQRLLAHVATIKDEDVAEEYQGEFRLRFERQFRSAAPARRGQQQRRGSYRPVAVNGGVVRAIIAGVLRFPEILERELEPFGMMPVTDDMRELHSAITDFALDHRPPRELLPALTAAGLGSAAAAVKEGHRLSFSFVRPDSDDDEARRDLVQAIYAQASAR